VSLNFATSLLVLRFLTLREELLVHTFIETQANFGKPRNHVDVGTLPAELYRAAGSHNSLQDWLPDGRALFCGTGDAPKKCYTFEPKTKIWTMLPGEMSMV